jgi:hypothetical protein
MDEWTVCVPAKLHCRRVGPENISADSIADALLTKSSRNSGAAFHPSALMRRYLAIESNDPDHRERQATVLDRGAPGGDDWYS